MDGAIFYNLEKAGIGCVLRDHLRNPFMAASSPEKAVANLETIEVLAILCGVQVFIAPSRKRLPVDGGGDSLAIFILIRSW